MKHDDSIPQTNDGFKRILEGLPNIFKRLNIYEKRVVSSNNSKGKNLKTEEIEAV